MTRKTLKDAVLDVAVRCFTFPPKSFSAYDITKLLRADINLKLYDIEEFVGTATKFAQEVEHSDVREAVTDLFKSNHFDRTFNGTYFEYTIGSIHSPVTGRVTPISGIVQTPSYLTPKVDITTTDVYKRMIKWVENQFACNSGTVKASDNLVTVLGADDLDLVELEMCLEDEFENELHGITLDGIFTNTNNTPDSMYAFLKSKIEKNTSIKAAVNTPKQKVVPQVPVKDVLKKYIIGRFSNGVNPTLKNAQKAVDRPGTSVRDISNLAKELGYFVSGLKSIPFSEWTITAI